LEVHGAAEGFQPMDKAALDGAALVFVEVVAAKPVYGTSRTRRWYAITNRVWPTATTALFLPRRAVSRRSRAAR
jgi:hypothetical protein